MRLYRIAKQRYIEDFSGEGAKLYGGRWNKRGTHLLYFSSSLSLCVLEILVHFNQGYTPTDLYFVEIEVPDRLINFKVDLSEVKAYLRDNPPHFSTQQFGSNWVNKNDDFALALPSAVLPIEDNVIINPNHKNWSKVKVLKTEPLNLDARVIV